MNVGTFHGGTTKNTVPERAECELDLRFETVADGRALAARVEAAAREAALPGTRIEVSRGRLARPRSSAPRRPRRSRPSTAPASARAASAPARRRSPAAAPTRAPPAAAGVPSIDGLGPRGAGFHTRAEEVELASLVPKAQALLRFLAGRAGRMA